MSWAIHCRSDNGQKQYAVFSTVCMGYLSDRMDKSSVVWWAYQAERKDRARLVEKFGEQVCPWQPSLESWQKSADFAEKHGNSEGMWAAEDTVNCPLGCRCYRHDEPHNELESCWW